MSHMSYFYHTFVVFLCLFGAWKPQSAFFVWWLCNKTQVSLYWPPVKLLADDTQSEIYCNGSAFHLLSTRIFLVRCTDVFGLVCLCFQERVCLLLFSSVWELFDWWMENCRWVEMAENEAVSCRWSAWNAIMPRIGNLPPNILKVTLIRDIQQLL